MNINQTTKYILLTALAIFIVNIIFRYLTLTNCGVWYDEAFSIYYSQKELYMIKNTAQWDIAPPFYYYVLHYWMLLFGNNENEVRLLSILFTCIASPLLFILCIRFFNLNTAIFTSILFFTSNQLFYFSQEARTYSLVVLFSIISTYFFFELLQNQKWHWLILLGIVNWAAINSHYFFLFIPVIQFAIVLLTRNKKTLLLLIYSFCITALLFGKWLIRIYEVMLHGSVSKEITHLTFSDLLILIKSLGGETILFYSILPFVLIGLFYFFISKNKYSNTIQASHLVYILLWALFPILLVYFLSNGRGGIFTPRYLLFTTPGICMVNSFFISHIPLNRILKSTLMLLLFLTGLFTINYNFSKFTDHKNAVPYIKSEIDNNTLIIVQTTSIRQLFTYYFDRKIFNDYKNIDIRMINKNVIFKDDSVSIHGNLTNGFKKIILVRTFPPFPDNIFLYLKKRYKSVTEANQFSEVSISLFTFPTNDTLLNINSRISALLYDYYQTEFDSRYAFYKSAIMNSPEWLNTIRLQAKKENEPLDSAVKKNILYLINIERAKKQ